MSNASFFEALFPQFWETLDRSGLTEDSNSMFGDSLVFEWIIETVMPRDIIDVGSWKGHSANFMADVCGRVGVTPRIVCVDTFLGGPEH